MALPILYPFQYPQPVTKTFAEHQRPYNGGVDFGVPVGTETLAGFESKVTRAAWDTTGYGLHVRLKAIGGRDLLVYGHLSSVAVAVGDTVRAGQVIGYSGNTGNSTGPHLHLEYRPDGVNPVDPEPMLVYGVVPEAPPVPPVVVNVNDRVRVMGDYLNIRTGPGTEFAQAGQVLGLTEWKVTEINRDTQGRLWYQINGAGNWLAGWLCEATI